jgi:hypothetical protein
VVAAGRRGQPAPAAGTWPNPPRRRLGTGVTRAACGLGSPRSALPPASRPILHATLGFCANDQSVWIGKFQQGPRRRQRHPQGVREHAVSIRAPARGRAG